jgi:hypothetical protein
MANVRAVKSGNWSDTTVWSTGALPTTADDVYANNFTVTIDQDVTVLTLRTTSATGISAGGGFVISTSVTVTCTNSIGIQPGTTTAVTVSANSPAVVTINSNLTSSPTTNSVNCILKSGTCTLNVTGTTLTGGGGSDRHFLNINASGTVNFVGNVRGFWSSSRGILINTGATGAILNVTGDINPDRPLGSAQNALPIVISSVCTVNITGNVYGDFGNSTGVSINAAASVYITGNVFGGQQASGTGGLGISTSAAVYLSIVGIIDADYIGASTEAVAVASTSTSAINLFTGPFVVGRYGTMPFLVSRMHLKPTANSYFEFRDNSTNGALPPGAVASASYLYSPSTVVNGPSQNDVRFGTVYASGSQTGQMRVPLPSQVSVGIPVDNTTGSAVLTGADIANSVWNKLTSEITASNSIGERLKNVSTPATTGAQITSLT